MPQHGELVLKELWSFFVIDILLNEFGDTKTETKSISDLDWYRLSRPLTFTQIIQKYEFNIRYQAIIKANKNEFITGLSDPYAIGLRLDLEVGPVGHRGRVAQRRAVANQRVNGFAIFW